MKQKWTFGTFTTEIQLYVHYSFMNYMGFFYTKAGIAHKITQTCPYFICFWHQDKEFFFKLCCFEALKYDLFWVLQNICKLIEMWIRVFLVSRNDYKTVSHCDRWGTPLECFLLMAIIPQVVPTYGYFQRP